MTTVPGESSIADVAIKSLREFSDGRGLFEEIFRESEDFFTGPFAQISHSVTFQGVAKAWHLHHKQTDYITVISGDMRLCLYDLRDTSPTKGTLLEILMGETLGRKCVRVPPGIAHGYKALNGPMHVIYVMDREYDPDDEHRLAHDDPKIGYDWLSAEPVR